MRRFFLISFVVTLATLAGASVAAADKPTRFALPAQDFTLTGVCPFPVEIQVVENREYATVFSNGSLLVTGSLRLRLTNTTPGESLTVNASGPARFTPNDDGTTTLELHGRTLLFLTTEQTSEPFLHLISGHVVLRGSEHGPTDVLAEHGSVTDLCEVLAS